MKSSDTLKSGIYQHYKGKHYEVIEVVKHSETLERMVVYRALYGSFKLWVRPLVIFLEEAEHNDMKVPRFKFISNQPIDSFLKSCSPN